MNWLRTKVLNWLHGGDKPRIADHTLGHDNPLLFALGQSGERHYITVPVENGFALITRSAEDMYSATRPSGPRAAVTFCPDAENLANTIIAKMTHYKLTAR